MVRNQFRVTTLLDIDREKCREFSSCKIADTPRELAQQVDIIITGNLIR